MKKFPVELRHGSGEMMTLDPTRLLVAFKRALGLEEIEAYLRDYGLVLEDFQDTEQEKAGRPFDFVNHTDQRFWVRSQTAKTIDQKLLAALQDRLAETLDWIGPVYRLGKSKGRDGLLCPLPNVLLIRPIQKLTKQQQKSLEKRLQEYGLKEVRKKSADLGDYRYYVIPDIRERTAYQLQGLLLQQEKKLILEAKFENMPIIVPMMAMPNDMFFPQQWGMIRIQAGGEGTTGWNLSTGAGVTVCVMDSGCDLDHPDLSFVNDGINLGTMLPPALPTPAGMGDGRRAHGTLVAGIVAGRYNNRVGVAGVAGNCRILPLAIENSTDWEIYRGIRFAADHGAHVICICYGQYDGGGWDFVLIGEAIRYAYYDRHCVIVSSTGNEDRGDVNRYPARDPLVIAVGGSDQRDNRKSPASPDGEAWWGANYGPGISVVAPTVLNPTTDIRGNAGYNANNGGPFTFPGHPSPTYPTCGDAAGDYFFLFTGTSSAAPQVAGLAAALRNLYPLLKPWDVRNIIERTAAKVGGAYADVPGFPNGTRNREMGYGRINMYHALDFADMMIKDWQADLGTEPSTPPGDNFWSFSDIVITSSDDTSFIPDDPIQSSTVRRPLPNYLKIRVTNNGPHEARNVVVNARIIPYVGLEFVYPADWTSIDAAHISPDPVTSRFASIRPNGSEIARFTLSRAQVETLWGWVSRREWHPCLLASVNSDNDYAFANASITGDGLVKRRNNLAQKNLSVISLETKSARSYGLRRPRQFPFVAGSLFNAEHAMQILVDRSRLPQTIPLLVALDEDSRAFPLLDLRPSITSDKLEEGGLSLERAKIGKVSVKGGKVIVRGGRRFVEVQDEIAVISMEKQANQLYPFSLRCTIPAEARVGDSYVISVAQRNKREETVGGATIIYHAK